MCSDGYVVGTSQDQISVVTRHCNTAEHDLYAEVLRQSIQGATLDRVLEGLADNRIGMRTELRRVLEFDDKVRFGSGVSATAARRAQPISPHVLPADRASPEVSARTKAGRDLRPINRTGGESIGLRRGAVSGTNQGNSRVRFGRGCVKLAQQIGD